MPLHRNLMQAACVLHQHLIFVLLPTMHRVAHFEFHLHQLLRALKKQSIISGIYIGTIFITCHYIELI